MKVAVSSSSFAAAFRRGTLTHLEWIEACASRLDADGVAFGRADFPRADAEYAAQCRKVAVDLGLVPAALDAPGLLDPQVSDEERSAAIALASTLGTSLLRTTAGAPGELPPQTFVATVAAAKAMAKAAKAVNVTLAVSCTPGSLVATLADLKHLAKDVDSAWLRYEIAVDDPDRDQLGPRDRVVVERVAIASADALDEGAVARRGWFVLDGDGGAEPLATLGSAIRTMRAVEARGRLAPA